MHTSSMLKKEFLKKWMKGLQICYSSNKKMDLIERKKKIKLSANIAMACAKKPATSWSNALILKAKQNKQDKNLVSKLLEPEPLFNQLLKSRNRIMSVHKRVQCKKILKRSCNSSCGKRRIKKNDLATIIVAKRLVKKRTKVLKKLVPGGESMNELSLIKEAMDYILCLKAQVDVMRNVVTAAEVSFE